VLSRQHLNLLRDRRLAVLDKNSVHSFTKQSLHGLSLVKGDLFELVDSVWVQTEITGFLPFSAAGTELGSGCCALGRRAAASLVFLVIVFVL
jgi:hypothetical protein